MFMSLFYCIDVTIGGLNIESEAHAWLTESFDLFFTGSAFGILSSTIFLVLLISLWGRKIPWKDSDNGHQYSLIT